MISLRLYITPFFLSMIFFQSTAQSNATKPFVKVDGEVTMPLSLYAEDLAKMNQRTVSMKDHDGKEVTYKGVTVQEILERSGVTIKNCGKKTLRNI